MDIVSSDDAKEILEPHILTIKEIFMTSWQKFGQIPTDLNYQIGSRSRACIVHDFICHEAKHKFDNVPGVSIANHPNFFLLNFSNRLLMRFKMFDNYLRVANIPTNVQEAYKDQTIQLQFPFAPPSATKLFAGYQLNRAQTSIKNAFITCFQEDDLLWYFSIFGEGTDPSQQELPIDDEPPMSGPKVRARKIIRKKSTE